MNEQKQSGHTFVMLSIEEANVMNALYELMEQYEPCVKTEGGLIHTDNGMFLNSMMKKYDNFIRKKYNIPSRWWKIDYQTCDIYKPRGEYLMSNGKSDVENSNDLSDLR